MFSEYIRRIVFWRFDSMKGGIIKKHYSDIENRMEKNISPETSLPSILDYAVANVPFYQRMDPSEFNSFPVMTKNLYNNEPENMRSKEYTIDKNLHWVRTSGSTGTPFRAPQDSNKRNRTIAELLYFHDVSGWKLGERFLFIRAWVAYNASLSRRIMKNFIPFEATNFSENNKKVLLDIIKKDKKLRILFGYSSVISDLAEYMISNNDCVQNNKIKLVVVDSDTLLIGAKEKIEKAFGCPVMNRYDNEEHGVLACMKPGDDYWTVNTASYYIELLRINSDEPCSPGEVGRVVVTDLTNHAMPFIRYDVGDLAFSNDYNGKFAEHLNGLEGKANDIILDTNGNSVRNVSFAAYFELFMDIKKYQLIQVSEKEYLIKIVLKKNGTVDEQQLITKFQECLGNDAVIEVSIVADIERTKAGKYRPVINLYK